ncbi:hypothetical protein BDR26DRAFT_979613 [Obelidium mucronatum]|nr:hypothetical protein BDR26DRAFT_979613 [Obelidium mucronatum]
MHALTVESAFFTKQRSKLTNVRAQPLLQPQYDRAMLDYVEKLRHPIFANHVIKLGSTVSACQWMSKKIRAAGIASVDLLFKQPLAHSLTDYCDFEAGDKSHIDRNAIDTENPLPMPQVNGHPLATNESEQTGAEPYYNQYDPQDYDPLDDPVPDLPETQYYSLESSSTPSAFHHASNQSDWDRQSSQSSKRKFSDENLPAGKRVAVYEVEEPEVDEKILLPITAVEEVSNKHIESICLLLKHSRLLNLSKSGVTDLVSDKWPNALYKVAYCESKTGIKKVVDDTTLKHVLEINLKKGAFSKGFSLVVFISTGPYGAPPQEKKVANQRRDMLDQLVAKPHRFDSSALTSLKELYVGTCSAKDKYGDHANGCFRKNGLHLLLKDDPHFRSWSRALASTNFFCLMNENEKNVTVNVPPNYGCFDIKNAHPLGATSQSTLDLLPIPNPATLLQPTETGGKMVTITFESPSGQMYKLANKLAISPTCSVRSILEREAGDFLEATAGKDNFRLVWRVGSVTVSHEGPLWTCFNEKHIEIEGARAPARFFDL